MSERDTTAPCPHCQKAIGVHTIDGYADCLKSAGFDYQLPYEEIPDGPLRFPATDGDLCGEVTVMAGLLPSPLGVFPVLRFVFTGSGPNPMERRNLPPINLVMDSKGLRHVKQLIGESVDKAIIAARRAR